MAELSPELIQGSVSPLVSRSVRGHEGTHGQSGKLRHSRHRRLLDFGHSRLLLQCRRCCVDGESGHGFPIVPFLQGVEGHVVICLLSSKCGSCHIHSHTIPQSSTNTPLVHIIKIRSTSRDQIQLRSLVLHGDHLHVRRPIDACLVVRHDVQRLRETQEAAGISLTA